MITFEQGNTRFNVRTVGIILHDGRVLLQSAQDIDFWVMPGGRCELGESSQDAIIREMREEIGAEVGVERLVWVLESFFDFQETTWHEISFLFLLSLPPDSVVYARQEEFYGYEPLADLELTFRWFSLDELENITLYPAFLRTALRSLPDTTQYLTWGDK